MADITKVFMGFINQLITGGYHPVGNGWEWGNGMIINYCTSDEMDMIINY